jgi:signal transduction histidine kinase
MNKFQKQITYFSILFYAICLVFILYCIYGIKNEDAAKLSICFSIIVIVIFNGLIFSVKKYIISVLEKLTELINTIIDGNEDEIFSVLNDDLLSKLQNQTTKLTGILKSQNNRLSKEKGEIQSLISDISHQLKTPFANLKMYCEFLKNNDISNEEREEFVSIINNQLEKLDFLIESMIKMSRLESGIIALKIKQCCLDDICLGAIKQAYEKAKSKNIEIEFDSNESVEIFIDEKWTIEAVFNIIDNGIKYTNSNGKIVITTKRFEMFVMIEIKDNGRGINEAEINNIFKRFYRGKNSGNEDGVGIGLYLSREIVSMQKGFVKVKSEENKGSSFSIMFPLGI